MSSTISSFFSRDVFLQRQGHIRRGSSRRGPPLITNISSLEIIVEEDEPKSSLSIAPSTPSVYSVAESRCPSPSLSDIKTKRRHAGLTPSDVRAAQEILSDVESDLDEEDCLLPWLSRPYIPPTLSPGLLTSADAITLTFQDATLDFPQPPPTTPTSVYSFETDRQGSVSPALSCSSNSAESPTAESFDFPCTPPTSEDECDPPKPPPRNPLRLSLRPVKPLQITKHNTSKPDLRLSEDEFLLSSPLLTDQEWYTREFSEHYTLGPQDSTLPSASATRPTAMMMCRRTRSDSVSFLPLPARPKTPVSAGFPNTDLDPAFPRCSRTSSVRGRPLPPLPTTPTSAIFSNTDSEPSLQRRASTRGPLPTPPPTRPPPRTTLPADYGDSFSFADDRSALRMSYRDDLSIMTSPSHWHGRTLRHTRSSSFPESVKSFYSQSSFLPTSHSSSSFSSSFPFPFVSPPAYSAVSSEPFPPRDIEEERQSKGPELSLDDVEFEFGDEGRMKLPLSLPSSPVDLEVEMLDAFEALRLRTSEI